MFGTKLRKNAGAAQGAGENIFENNEVLCDTCPTITMPVYAPKAVQLWVVDSTGCAISDAVKLTPSLDIFAPNAISPSSGGANAIFYLQSKRPLLVKNLSVYDRWGELVFSKQNFLTNEPFNGWDGASRSGEANSGVFVWFAEIQTAEGFNQKILGVR